MSGSRQLVTLKPLKISLVKGSVLLNPPNIAPISSACKLLPCPLGRTTFQEVIERVQRLLLESGLFQRAWPRCSARMLSALRFGVNRKFFSRLHTSCSSTFNCPKHNSRKLGKKQKLFGKRSKTISHFESTKGKLVQRQCFVESPEQPFHLIRLDNAYDHPG